MKITNLNRPGVHAEGIVRGRNGRRAGSSGPNVSDSDGNEVDLASYIIFSGATVTEADADTALVTISGGGGGSSGSVNVVVDYGAIGDGVTDDRAAIQAAADAAAAACASLFFPGGSYLIGSPGLVIDPTTPVIGDGRECTSLLADANSMNLITVTGTAFSGGSFPLINTSSTISGLRFAANGHTAVEGIAYVGVAYFDTRRCTFDGNAIGIEYYGALQGVTEDCLFIENTRGIKYSAQTIGYYGASVPPARVLVDWCSFYTNTTLAIDWTGAQQLIVQNSEFGDNGTAASSTTGAIKATMGGDAGGFGLVARNLWMESNHGGAAIALSGTVVGKHSLTDIWFAYTDATYSVSLDGSTAAQTLSMDRVHHDQVVSPATVKLIRAVGGTTTLDARWSDGTLSGSWTKVSQTPLLDDTLVSDLSQFTALSLPATTSPSQTADGYAVWDSDDNVLTVGDGASRKTFGYVGSTTPLIEGTAAAGSSNEVSRADHVHPTGSTERRILLADAHATPFVFTDLLQMDDGSDFLWSDS